MRAFVTGGTGFVGSAVVRALLGEGCEVVCLVRPSSPRDNLRGLDVTLVEGDLLDLTSLERAAQGCDRAFHVAAYYSTRPEEAALMERINVEGTRDMLAAAERCGVSRVVVTSTIGTIGRPSEDRLPHEGDVFTDLTNASPYARSKLAAERLALDAANRGLDVVVVNPCAPVGARDIKPSSTGQRILDYCGRRAPAFSPGGINFVSVEDVARGHLLAAERGQVGERYILGNSHGNLMRGDFYHIMEQVTGQSPPSGGRRSLAGRVKSLLARLLRPAPPAASPAPGFRPVALTADPSKAIRELGLPQTSLDVAFAEAVSWFREQRYI